MGPPASKPGERRSAHGLERTTPRTIKQTGLAMKDIDLIEMNEAFAAQAVYCQRVLEIPDEKLNG